MGSTCVEKDVVDVMTGLYTLENHQWSNEHEHVDICYIYLSSAVCIDSLNNGVT